VVTATYRKIDTRSYLPMSLASTSSLTSDQNFSMVYTRTRLLLAIEDQMSRDRSFSPKGYHPPAIEGFRYK
jgi:hypothetical protein